MNILVIGSGGREHAFVWKLAQSKKIDHIYICPGNAGTGGIGTNLSIEVNDFHGIKQAVIDYNIKMVVVGPEIPLVGGIHDFFLNDDILRKIPVIGPTKRGAMLEGSKKFAKEFMARHSIPTAAYKSFSPNEIPEAYEFMKSLDPPYVIKADGLAAGKGVLILDDIEEAKIEIEIIFGGKFGTAGDLIVIEEFLPGIELSVFVITDGKTYKLLPEAKDYKRIGEGDTGLNTGGMGAVSPVMFADEPFIAKVTDRIIKPTINGLKEEGIDYKGFIFFGLINVKGDPYVIEYNVRMGDPETEVVIPRIKSDLFDLLEGVAEGNLEKKRVEVDNRFATTVMMVSGGYPGNYEKGKEIFGLEQTDKLNSVVFHAGTKQSGSRIVSSGGRVLSVTAWGDTLDDSLRESYKNIKMISFENSYYRKDIGFDFDRR
jgi:phosphoribosylamine--glycine ligase